MQELYTKYSMQEREEMREWIKEHYHFGHLDISDYMVFSFLDMRDKQENLHLGYPAKQTA